MASPHNILLTQAHRRVDTELQPKLAERLRLDEKNIRTISLTSWESETLRDKAEAARSHAQNGMIRNFLRHIVEEEMLQ